MRKMMKNSMLLLLTGILVLLTPLTASAESSSNYTFGAGATVYREAPVAYEVERVYHARDIEGVDADTGLDGLAGMFVTEDSLYVSTANAVLVLDYNFRTKHVLDEYKDLNGNEAKITSPNGIFVTDEGLLYVCEPSQEHILVFDSSYKLVASYGKPEGLFLDNRYQPTSVVVDSLDRMYVIATGVYEGILEISSENKFQRYFGTTTVSISVMDIFFRAIASEAQLSRQALILPTEYSAMTINDKGFIYTTIRSTDGKNPIRLLNVNGNDIMPENWEGDSPEGDKTKGNNEGSSSLSYIDCNDYDMFMVLDSTQNRIFTYDNASNMLFVFGGSGDKDGCFRNPVSVRWMRDSNRVIVADRSSQSITIMKPTNYASAIFEAVRLEAEGDRAGAVTYWQQALDMNYNCNVAKDALGRQLYWEGDYEGSQAMLGEILRTDYYSMAFEKTRESLIRAYAPTAVVVLVVLIVALTVFRRVRRAKRGGYNDAG